MSVQAALMSGTEKLRAAGVEDPVRDARKLMASCLGIASDRLTLHLHDPMDDRAAADFQTHIEQRCAGKPVSHLLGWREFYGRRFEVGPAVLDPRPETETLVSAALSGGFGTVLDLGTGSGCILLSLLAEHPDAMGTGSDASAAALQVAQRNALVLGVEDRCRLIESDWFAAIAGQFDLIVSNPPYIAADEMPGLQPELSHEPRLALTDEGDGLSAYRVITAGAGAHLRPGGRLIVEIGWTQGGEVTDMFSKAGFAEVCILPDLEGRDRVIQGRWPG